MQVVVADDSAIFRANFIQYLKSIPGIDVVGEAENGLQALELVRQLEPDVLLLDLRMPQMDGIGVLRRLAEEKSMVRVVVISAHDKSYLKTLALKVGAVDFLSKDDLTSNLTHLVHLIKGGESSSG